MKHVWIGLLVVLCVAVITPTPCQAQGVPGTAVENESRPHDHGLAGTWLLTVTFEPYAPFRMLLTVDPDGTFNGPIPDLASDREDTRSACVGPWKHTRGRTYQMTMYCLDSQALDGVFGRGRFDLTLSEDGLSVSDPNFKFEWWVGHPSNGVYLGYGYGSTVGERLPNVPKD